LLQEAQTAIAEHEVPSGASM